MNDRASRNLGAGLALLGALLSLPECARRTSEPTLSTGARSSNAREVSASALASVATPTAVSGSTLPASPLAAPPVASAPVRARELGRLPSGGKLDLRFEITRDGSSGEQTLWGSLPALVVREAIGHSNAPNVCGVTFEPGNDNIAPPPRSRVSFVNCGGSGQDIPIKIEAGALWFGEKRIAVPERSFLEHEALQQPLPPERDCGAARGTPVTVTIARDAAQNIYLQIPALHVKHPLGQVDPTRDYCTTTVLPRAQRLNFECIGSGRVRLAVQRDVLFLETASYESMEGEYHRRRQGFELPCNAQVKLAGFYFRSPGWLPNTGSTCNSICELPRTICSIRCQEKFSDESGQLDEKGWACEHRCDESLNACAQHCSPR